MVLIIAALARTEIGEVVGRSFSIIERADLDLVLWIVRVRMVHIAFDLELASMHADDRAANTSSLGNSSSCDHGS